MQENSLVTVICLCYNHEKYVIESLNSVLNQDYPFIELIIIDDCSTDQSQEIISKWCIDHPDAQFFISVKNIGNTKNFNKGLSAAKGAFIIDLAADDVLMPNCVSLQLQAFRESKYKNLGVVYGNAIQITENGEFDSYYFPVDSTKKTIEKRQTGDIYLNVLSGGNSICSISAMTKRSVFDALNGYDERLAYEDLDFWIRASRQYEFDYIDEVLIKRRIISNSLTTAFYNKKHKRLKAINRSTYIVLQNTLQLNKSKEEDKALQKRVHYEIIHTFKIKQYGLLLKNIMLKLKLFWRINF
ncbi:glycosyltransferase [Flavobacterium hungaricum]|uniref:Glycosyltransferase n=1 Tax=Flavobacterium hungaricum TaxID=2082725 RepID=A0ABR9TEE9_9FLAO|nr:glycosyltransferase [Flavobacterium hungaricum]MBE8723640.1 glycosyltransferase [Flavobacterium hungaricum]